MMISRKTTRSLMIAGLIAGLTMTSAPTVYADPQAPGAAETTTDPSLRPNTPMPDYPKQSRSKKEAGVVRVKLCVDAAGHVTKADLAQTSGFPNLDAAVMKWVQGVQFNAAMKGATPVAVCDFPLKYEFQVTKGPTRQEQTTNPFDIGPATGLAAGP